MTKVNVYFATNPITCLYQKRKATHEDYLSYQRRVTMMIISTNFHLNAFKLML